MTPLIPGGVLAIVAVLAMVVPACTKTPSPAHRGARAQPRARVSGGQRASRARRPGRYTIKFDRRKTVGMRYRLVSSGTMDTAVRLNGTLLAGHPRKTTHAFDGMISVLAIHASGRFLRVRIRINKLVQSRNGVANILLSPGTIVLGESVADKKRFTVGGKAVGKTAAEFLGYAVSLYTGDDTTTDELIGPGEAKNPGDTWRPNYQKMLKHFTKDRQKLALMPRLKDIEGKVTFVAVQKVNGIQSYVVRSRTRVDNIAPKLGSMKPQMGHMELDLTGWVPADPSLIIGGGLTSTMKILAVSESKVGRRTLNFIIDSTWVLTTTEYALP